MKQQLATAVAVLFALGFSVGVTHAADPKEGGSVLWEETRVVLGPCFFGTVPEASKLQEKIAALKNDRLHQQDKSVLFFGAVGAQMLATAAEVAVDFTVGALKAAGDDKSTSAVTAFPANGLLYQLNDVGQLVLADTRCIQIVSGSWWDGIQITAEEAKAYGSATDQAAKTKALEGIDAAANASVVNIDNLVVTQSKLGNTALPVLRWRPEGATSYSSSREAFDEKLSSRFRQLRTARFFFEARIDQVDDARILLAPNAMYFEEAASKGFFESRQHERNLVVTLALANAGSSDGTAFGSVSFPFRDVPANTLLSPLYFRGQASKPISAPALSAEQLEAVTAVKANLTKATKEVLLARRSAQDAPVSAYEPRSAFDPVKGKESSYVTSLRRYCLDVAAHNAALSKASKSPALVAASDCPVDLKLKKLALDNQLAQFTKEDATAEARYNTAKFWTRPLTDPDSRGVTCEPGPVNKVYKANCKIKPIELHPYTVSTTVVEVREGSKLAGFLAKVLEKSQPAIKTSLEASLPGNKASAAEQAVDDQDAYDQAIDQVAIARAKLAIATTPLEIAEAQAALNAKIDAANKAGRKVGASSI